MRYGAKLFGALLISLGALLLVPKIALAHPVAQGSAAIDVTDKQIHLSVRISLEQVLVFAAHQKNILSGDDALTREWLLHGRYFLDHTRVSIGGTALPGTAEIPSQYNSTGSSAALPPPPTDGSFVLYEFTYPINIPASQNSASGDLQLSQTLLNEFDYAPGNKWEATFIVTLKDHGHVVQEGLLWTSRSPLDLTMPHNSSGTVISATSTADESTGHRLALEFLKHGIMHILTGYDHLLFVSALVLAARSLWDLIKIVSTFTLSHSLTLTLATFNIIRLPSHIVEPFIAGSIVFVALQNALWPKASRGWSRLAIAFFFGLFHGLGFAGGLADAMSQMSMANIWVALIAFSIGVETGHQIVVLPLFGLIAAMRSTRPSPEQAARFSSLVMRGGSTVIAMAGSFYLVAALQN